MQTLKLIITLFFIFLFSQLEAQNGIIRGTIFDESPGEPMMSVTVVIEGTINGTVSDLDGKFNLSVAPGTYNLKFSFVSYETLQINDVKVEAGEVTLLDNLKLESATFGLSEVVVSANVVRNTEGAMLSIKMKSPNVVDGISSVNFRKMGDSDAASSMKRVPGVSVEGGKYVYVRGLGDRYTKTILNGVDIPGLDPDRNTFRPPDPISGYQLVAFFMSQTQNVVN
ncbi:MAG TPA: carboxypeptidase-like regulatory domain-containing protein [Bacteroidales bacterium]|nr:carboxypeptidase-like regulatory domain-containing protein [Bacteroidales bacterium]